MPPPSTPRPASTSPIVIHDAPQQVAATQPAMEPARVAIPKVDVPQAPNPAPAVQEPAVAAEPSPILPRHLPEKSAEPSAATVISPPKLLQMRNLVLPAIVHNVLGANPEFEVKVFVDASGRASKVIPPTHGVAARYIAATLARETAFWKFQPATVNGVPVNGELVVRLKFSSK